MLEKVAFPAIPLIAVPLRSPVVEISGPQSMKGMGGFGFNPIAMPLSRWGDHFLEMGREGIFSEMGVRQGVFLPHPCRDRVYFQPVPESPGNFSDPMNVEVISDRRLAGARLFAKHFPDDSIVPGWRFWILSSDKTTWFSMHSGDPSNLDRGNAIFPLVHESRSEYVGFVDEIYNHFGWGDDR